MLTRILGISLAAGAIAGVLTATIQHFVTVPLILQGEVYEKAAESKAEKTSWTLDSGARVILAHADALAQPEGHAGHHQDAAEAWEPADGTERTLYASVATVGTGVGFALMLLAAMLASRVPINVRSAALWGLGAFIATGLAPGLGLSPELPGSAAAELLPRQIWWTSTALATAAGIWLLFQRAQPLTVAIGLLLIVAPHLIGAPHPDKFASTAPAELAGHFASASLAVQAVLWLTVGALVGYFWDRSQPA